jgi:transposase
MRKLNNIILIFLPPYSQGLNLAEHIWRSFKRDFSNLLFEAMDGLNYYLFGIANALDNLIVKLSKNLKKSCNFA